MCGCGLLLVFSLGIRFQTVEGAVKEEEMTWVLVTDLPPRLCGPGQARGINFTQRIKM